MKNVGDGAKVPPGKSAEKPDGASHEDVQLWEPPAYHETHVVVLPGLLNQALAEHRQQLGSVISGS